MPEFIYKAVDLAGRVHNGVLDIESEAALEARLAEAEQTLIDAKDVSGGGSKAGSTLGEYIPALAVKVKRRDLIDFTIQLAALLQSGVNLMETVKTIAEDTQNEKFKEVLEDLAHHVEAGFFLYEGMERYPTIFNRQFTSMIKAGEQGGTLPETIREITSYLEWYDRLMGDVKQATIYPTMVLIALVLFITILFTFVVPKFIAILVQLKVALPLPTRVVMFISEFFVATWWMWLFVPLVTPALVRTLKVRSEKFHYFWDQMKLSIPVFGEMNRMFTIARFARTFSTLFGAGIPILQIFQLCQPVVGNKVLETALGETEKELAEGISMSESFRTKDIFTPMVLRMVSVGESTGDVGAALANVSHYYNEEIPRRVKKVFGIIEPSVMLFLIAVVGFVALSIFMPILSLMSSIK